MCAFGAEAAEWSGPVSLPAGTITEAVTVTGEATVEVASGIAYVTGGISGSARITKTGAGELFIVGENTGLSSPITIDAGYLTGSNTCALGTGKITILGQREGFSGDCGLKLWGVGAGSTEVLTYGNEVEVTGNTTAACPGLVMYGQYGKLTGKITAAQDFVFYDDFTSTAAISSSQSNRYQKVGKHTLGEVEVAGTLGTDGWVGFIFTGKVKTPVFNAAIGRPDKWTAYTGNSHSLFRFKTQCEIGKIVNSRHPIFFDGKNFANGVLYTSPSTGTVGQFFNQSYVRDGVCDGTQQDRYVTLYEQEFAGFESCDWEGKENNFCLFDSAAGAADYGGGHEIVKITGVPPDEGETEKELTSCHQFGVQKYSGSGSAVSILVDAYEGFTQTFHDRLHHMKGTITVSNGTMRVTGAAAFSNAVALTVGPKGRFKLETTAAHALMSVADLTIEGEFSVSASATELFRTTALSSLRLGKDATISFEGGSVRELHATALYYEGERLFKGTWTHSQLACLPEGLAIVADSGDPQKPTSTEAWTDAAPSDSRMSTDGNWQSGRAPDLASGRTAVTVAEGAAMRFADGMRINALTVDGTAEVDATAGFAIGPETEGGALTVDRAITVSDVAGDVTLSGTIAAPFGVDQGEATKNGSSTFTFVTSAEGHGKALILSNATIAKPFYCSLSTKQNTLNTAPDTVNEFVGEFFMSTPAGYWGVDANSELIFSGGCRLGWSPTKRGAGTMRVRNRPFRKTGTTNKGFTLEQGRMVFEVSGNDIGYRKDGLSALSNGFFTVKGDNKLTGLPAVLEFTVDHAFTNGCLYAPIGYTDNETSANYRLIYGQAISSNELHGTVQTVEELHLLTASPYAVVHGDAGSGFEILTGGSARIPTTGGAGYHMMGSGEFALVGRSEKNLYDPVNGLQLRTSSSVITEETVNHTSTGTLEVSSGRFVLADDVTWLNGTNFVINGTGTMKFSTGRQINRRTARLTFADGGRVEIPEGVELVVAMAAVRDPQSGDWTEVEPDTYVASGTGVLANRITGGGSLRVRGLNPGVVLLVY